MFNSSGRTFTAKNRHKGKENEVLSLNHSKNSLIIPNVLKKNTMLYKIILLSGTERVIGHNIPKMSL